MSSTRYSKSATNSRIGWFIREAVGREIAGNKTVRVFNTGIVYPAIRRESWENRGVSSNPWDYPIRGGISSKLGGLYERRGTSYR